MEAHTAERSVPGQCIIKWWGGYCIGGAKCGWGPELIVTSAASEQVAELSGHPSVLSDSLAVPTSWRHGWHTVGHRCTLRVTQSEFPGKCKRGAGHSNAVGEGGSAACGPSSPKALKHNISSSDQICKLRTTSLGKLPEVRRAWQPQEFQVLTPLPKQQKKSTRTTMTGSRTWRHARPESRNTLSPTARPQSGESCSEYEFSRKLPLRGPFLEQLP